jgi:predicted nucleotidyltransferase component of viral defense system
MKIPRAHITAWRRNAPRSTDAQVEQDLVLSRVLIEIYSDPVLSSSLAFRGGTALHKLFLNPAARYSEDIDLVQIEAGAIGPIMTALRGRLDSWLGEPKRKQSDGRAAFIYRFEAEVPPVTPLRVKFEINTREHFAVLGFAKRHVTIDNPWFAGQAEAVTYQLEELLATKLRAFHQHKKGHDLFDLAVALDRYPALDVAKLIDCFLRYMGSTGCSVSRAEFEANLAKRLADPVFHANVAPLLARHAMAWSIKFDVAKAAETVHRLMITRLPGEPWKGRSD